jgi:hypothetical protein
MDADLMMCDYATRASNFRVVSKESARSGWLVRRPSHLSDRPLDIRKALQMAEDVVVAAQKHGIQRTLPSRGAGRGPKDAALTAARA